MDKRDTLVVSGTFITILKDLQETQQHASLLFDDNGLTRAEGMVTQVDQKEDAVLIYLNTGTVIPLRSIVAVNGTFLSDYSEC